MKSTSPSLVHRILAQHLGLPLDRIRGEHRLGVDLGLDRLDLVLVGVRVEEQEPGRGDFPVERLDPDMTVDDLDAIHRAWTRSRPAVEVAIEHDAATALRRWRRVIDRHTPAIGDEDADTERAPDTLRAAPWPPPPPPRRVPHILVADDDPEMRALLADGLCAEGYMVTEVADGVDLLKHVSHEALLETRYDAIVSDMVMPGVSGMGALMQLNYEPLAPPVVLITAFGDPEVHLWAQQLGAAATLDKPFDVDDLKTVLKRVEARARAA